MHPSLMDAADGVSGVGARRRGIAHTQSKRARLRVLRRPRTFALFIFMNRFTLVCDATRIDLMLTYTDFFKSAIEPTLDSQEKPDPPLAAPAENSRNGTVASADSGNAVGQAC